MINQKLLLFDIDGTLISSPEFLNDYSKHLESMLSCYFGNTIKVDFSGLHGNTERKNLIIMMKRQGFNPTERQMNDFFRVSGNNFKVSEDSVILLPYVSETVQKLSQGNVLGLVTGNPELVARKRIYSVGLEKYFPFGSFGNESEDRSKLVSLAMDRAKYYGWDGNRETVYLIGDTPKDVEAGKVEGVRTIAVTTGSATRQKLEESSPDYIIENLSEMESIL